MISRDIRMYCGRFVGPSHTAHGWSPCFIKITHARWIKIEPFAITVCTHTHTIFHTHAHNFVTHTHTIFLCHTPFFTYNIIQLCHAQLFFLLFDPPPPPLCFLPSPSPLQHLVLIIGRSCLVELSGPLIWLVSSTLCWVNAPPNLLGRVRKNRTEQMSNTCAAFVFSLCCCLPFLW